ncbi:MAG: 1-acyl-sn-glycerol-3-phosphate acyltransferase [Bacteroidales bacterium]|jgi:putative hemolysin|nr:1-acyl-sn-glycerol-3-phosphate acyltransferase [Bacteroidales bacterium]MDD4213732.1 1-acyl-sn-glycerol-3-phosphate acyltransferase [Bacteroidales bacterium]
MQGNNIQDKTPEKFIEIERVIGNKNPKLLKILPRFIINYLKRILHQDEINDFINRNNQFFGLDFVERIVKEFIKELNVSGIENLPAEGRVLIASNHPLGGLDGVALMHIAGKIRKNILFPVNDLLMNVKNLKSLFIPINKHGSNAQNVKIINDTFDSDATILYFPAGLVSRRQKRGVIHDLEWKKTFISYARKYERDIIPVYMEGRNSDFFYNFAKFRVKIGIKSNIEMLYLVDEVYKQKDKKINIIFGKPIPYSLFDKRFSDKEWAAKVKSYVYSLKSDCFTEFKI